ncbi:MAG: insulinase family protein [Candidatus Aminicenantes bacterium]|nr:insulinase family protein [Candidatus Aminicenantes bacterium]
MLHRLLSVVLPAAVILAAGGSAAGQDERFRQKPPAPDPRPEIRLPRLESATLTNGLQVTVAFRDPAPMTSLFLVLSAGEQASPKHAPGLASLASGVFGQGTQLRSAADLEENIERIGGSFAATADRDVILISFHFLEEHLDQALALLAEMILQPRISEREMKIIQSMISSAMSAQERNPFFLADRIMSGRLFEGHPYEHYSFGRAAMRAWTVRDLLEFWDRNIRPNNAQVILAGAVNINLATRKISHALATWRPRESERKPIPPPRPPERDRFIFIDLPQDTQCAICAGTVLPPLAPVERFSLLALSQLLGGSITSRLFLNLREKRSYAYETGSRSEFYRAGGVFAVRALVEPRHAAAAVREIFSEIKLLTREPPSSQEIDDAKSVLLGGFPLRLDRIDDFAGYVASMKATGAGDEIWSRFAENVIGIDSDGIFQGAKKFLAQPLVVVMAGSLKLCRESLAEFEEVEILDARGQSIETIRRSDIKGDGDEISRMCPELQRGT